MQFNCMQAYVTCTNGTYFTILALATQSCCFFYFILYNMCFRFVFIFYFLYGIWLVCYLCASIVSITALLLERVKNFQQLLYVVSCLFILFVWHLLLISFHFIFSRFFFLLVLLSFSQFSRIIFVFGSIEWQLDVMFVGILLCLKLFLVFVRLMFFFFFLGNRICE